MEIQRITPEYLEGVITLEAITYDPTLINGSVDICPEWDWWNEKLQDPNEAFGALIDGELVGFVLAKFTLYEPENFFEIDTLIVHPDYQNQKIGPNLLKAALESIDSKENLGSTIVLVTGNNGNAIKVYRRYGFQFDPESADNRLICMERPSFRSPFSHANGPTSTTQNNLSHERSCIDNKPGSIAIHDNPLTRQPA